MEERYIYALGFFDGVHLGHGALLSACRHMADALGCKAGAVTFTRHPASLVAGKATPLINTAQDRRYLMQTLYAMDSVTELPFDDTLRTMPWQDFLDMLLTKYSVAGLVCGYDFRFGYRGEGNAEKLRSVCGEKGIPCAVIPEQRLDGVTVSSTHIRSLLEQGQMEQAVRFLGHPHILSGTVVSGRHLGRTLGIPTANLVLPEGLTEPKHGVYACKARVEGEAYLAVTNVGTCPTVGGRHVTVEPWLLDFSGDLYGKQLTLEFYRFLRPEMKFSTLADLQAEIQKNAWQVREFFAKR